MLGVAHLLGIDGRTYYGSIQANNLQYSEFGSPDRRKNPAKECLVRMSLVRGEACESVRNIYRLERQ